MKQNKIERKYKLEIVSRRKKVIIETMHAASKYHLAILIRNIN